MEVSLIKVPLDLGAGTRGADRGPDALVGAGLVSRLRSLGREVEVSAVPVVQVVEDERESDSKAKNLIPLLAAFENIAKAVDFAVKDGRFPVVLGGDHSLALGSLAGLAANGQRTGVLYVDAHGDFNTTETTPTGNVHGMPLSAACGIGLGCLANVYFNGPKIRPDDICIIGARALDPEEKVLLTKHNVRVYTAEDVCRRGLEAVTDEALNYLNSRCDRLHLSFDVDSVDPHYAPGTGIRIPGGLTRDQALVLADALSLQPKLKSADIVEFDPTRDIEGVTCSLCLDFLSRLLAPIPK